MYIYICMHGPLSLTNCVMTAFGCRKFVGCSDSLAVEARRAHIGEQSGNQIATNPERVESQLTERRTSVYLGGQCLLMLEWFWDTVLKVL